MELPHDTVMDGMMGGRDAHPGMHVNHKIRTTHMTFLWGQNAEILLWGWPGTSLGMYLLALIVVFMLSVLVEWLFHCRSIERGGAHFATRLRQTVLHAARVGLAYMVTLAVMSFNLGVLIAAVAGHSVGFFVFGSGAFQPSQIMESPPSDLPPRKCCAWGQLE